MDPRDRRSNFGLLGAAALAWLAVGAVVLTIDPVADPVLGYVGALAIGIAVALTCAPLFWLAVFGRNRRIAYRGDWARAGRRGVWLGIVAAVFVVLRLEGILGLPIMLFVLALVVVAETTLSIER